MIEWHRVQVDPDDPATLCSQAVIGHFLCVVAKLDNGRWSWSVGIVGGDGAELKQGSSQAEYTAKSACRNAIHTLIFKARQQLMSKFRSRKS